MAPNTAGKGKATLGKGGKGLGKGGAKRHRKRSDAANNVPHAQLKRICRRAGCERIGGKSVYNKLNEHIIKFVYTTVSHAAIYAEHSKRKTILAADIYRSFKCQGHYVAGIF